MTELKRNPLSDPAFYRGEFTVQDEGSQLVPLLLGVEAGATVAVIGCGGVGLSAIQGASIAGAGRVIAVDMLDAKLELANAHGADVVINYRDENFADVIKKETGGRGVDIIIEHVGESVWKDALRS